MKLHLAATSSLALATGALLPLMRRMPRTRVTLSPLPSLSMPAAVDGHPGDDQNLIAQVVTK
eukprot:scaffold4649_cov117-Skeletonema_dohrnii-CCMP3373.AAC.5